MADTTPAKRRNVLFPRALFLPAGFLLLSACAGVSNHTTAKTLRKGQAQIAVQYTDYSVFQWIDSRLGHELGLGDARGGSVSLGVTDHINARLRFERNSIW